MNGVERLDGWFGPPGRPAFGRLYRPAAPRADASGVALCAPIGPEAAGTDRTLRHLAERLAARGCPVLRFDWDGTGDSAGDGLDEDRAGAWARTLREALAAAGPALGVSRWVLAGVRLGATLAVREAARRDDVDAVLAIAPVVSGRAFVRELTMFGLAGAALRDTDPAAGAAAHEAGGWAFDEAAWRAIGSIDLARDATVPGAPVQVFDGGRTAGLEAWVARLREAGAAVTVEPFAGFDAMIADPHLAEVPSALLDAVVGRIAGAPTPDAPTPPVRTSERMPREAWPAVARLRGAPGEDLVEHAVRVGGALAMAGVLTEPADAAAAAPRPPVLLLNAGAAPRSGPSRMTTLLARRLAARGHAVLRVDLPGLGDTPPREGEPDAVVYAPRALEAVRQAADWLRERRGGAAPWVGGLCSGAYHGFKAAAAGVPVAGVLAINPLTFFWHGQEHDDDTHRVIADAVRLQNAAARSGAWRRVLRGEVALSEIARILARRAAAQFEATRRALARRLGRPLDDDLEAELESIARRGVPLRFVFATDEPGPALLAFGGGATYRRLLARGAIGVDRIERSDHTFSSRAARERLAACVLARFDADGPGPADRPPAPATAEAPRTTAGAES